MKLTFLGTKGDIEESEWNHEKNASLLIEYKKKRYLIDFGKAFTRGDFQRIKPDYILLTHAHEDHIGGLAKLKPEDLKDVIVHCSKTCWEGPQDVKEPYKAKDIEALQSAKVHLFDRILKKRHKMGDIYYVPVPCWHSVKAPANVFVLYVGGKKIVYAPDVLHINKQEIVHLRDADLYIGDGSSLDRDLVRKPKNYKYPQVRVGHASIKTQLRWLQDLGIKQAIFTHFGSWALKMREQELRSKLLKLGKEYGVKVWAAQDGTTVTFEDDKPVVRLEALTLPGIYLVPPHGQLIAEGKKTLIVKSKKFMKYVGRPLYLVSGDKVYGIIVLKPPRGPYDADRIRTAMRDKHQISDEEWEKWWPDVDEVYIYEFDVVKLFDKPKTFKVPQGVQTFIEEVKLSEGLDIETFDPSELNDEQLVHYWAKCAAWLNKAKEGHLKWSVDEVLQIAYKVYREMIGRGIHPSPDTPLYKALSKKFHLERDLDLAPVHSFRPESEKGEPIKLDDVLPLFKPFYLKRPFILLVGGLVEHGETRGDIDVLILFPQRIPQRDVPLEFRLGRMLPAELSSRLHFLYGDYGGPFTDYVELYDLLVIPSKYRRKVDMEDLLGFLETHYHLSKEMPEEAKRAALVTREEDKIKLFRFFLFAKPQIGHRPGVAYSLDELKLLVDEFPVHVEKKYDGVVLQIHKDGKKVKVFTERGFDVTKRLPGLVEEIQSWKYPEKCILLADTEKWTKSGEYIGREEVAAYLMAKTPPDDTGIVANVFDIVYFFDPDLVKHDLNCQIGDLHHEPYSVRRRYLELLPIKQSVIDAPSIDTHFNVAPSWVANDADEMIKLVKKVSKAKASEGAVIKYAGSEYPLTGACYHWWKYKKVATAHAIILEVHPTKKKGIYRYTIGFKIPKGWEAAETFKLGDEEYMVAGKTMNYKGKLKPGTIVEVVFEELFYYFDEKTGKKQVRVYLCQIVGVRPEQNVPDTAEEVMLIANQVGVLRRKTVELEEIEEEDILIRPVDDKPRQFVLQIHWRGKGAHGDLRWERVPGGRILDGFTIALMKKGVAKEDVETLEQAKKLSVWENMKIKPDPSPVRVFAAEKAPEPREWLTYEGVVPPGSVGATRYEPGVFYIFDKGKLYLGVQFPWFRELFIEGKELKGRWVLRLIPRRKPATAKTAFLWLFGKPKDQTPYVLSRRAVKKRFVPPQGVSLLPPDIKKKIPKEFQYWRFKDEEKRLEVRDALVEAIKKGRVRLSSFVVKPVENVPFVLQRHWWVKRPLIRAGPTAIHWDLRIENVKEGPYLHFVCYDDPLENESLAAYLKPCPDHEWMKKGLKKAETIPPGTPGNPTKDTPAYILVTDKGKCSIITASDTFLRIQFHSGKMKGLWTAIREDPNSDIWLLSRAEMPQPK